MCCAPPYCDWARWSLTLTSVTPTITPWGSFVKTSKDTTSASTTYIEYQTVRVMYTIDIFIYGHSASPGIYVKLTGVKLGGRCADGLWNSRQDISPLMVATTSLFFPSRSRGDRQYALLCACRGTKWASCIGAIVSITCRSVSCALATNTEHREGWSLSIIILCMPARSPVFLARISQAEWPFVE